MASQRANRRQTCENDFSPPDSVLAPRPVLLSFVISGSTYRTVRLWRYRTGLQDYIPEGQEVYPHGQLEDDLGSFFRSKGT